MPLLSSIFFMNRCSDFESFSSNVHMKMMFNYMVLKMMHVVASHTSENQMTSSAVAACMSPFLLRPLLAGECELEDEYDISVDNVAQLLAMIVVANNSQEIVTILLEEYVLGVLLS